MILYVLTNGVFSLLFIYCYFLSLFDFESKTRINVNEMQTWPISSSFILLGFVTKVVSPCQTMLFLLSLDKCIKHRSG